MSPSSELGPTRGGQRGLHQGADGTGWGVVVEQVRQVRRDHIPWSLPLLEPGKLHTQSAKQFY